MNKEYESKIFLTILIILLVSLTGCTAPDITPTNHQFAYDTESVNIAIDKQNNLHLVWQERFNDEISIYYSKLDNFGNDLINDKKIYSMKIPKRIHRDPDIIIDDNDDVHIIFAINNNLYYSKLNNNGEFRIRPIQLTVNNCSTDGDILIDSNNDVHIVWTDWRSGRAQIYYTKLSNFGEILIEENSISQNNSYDPSIIIDSQEKIYICWYFEWLNEGIWDSSRHIQLSYIEMNKNGEILKHTNLDILGDNYKQSSVEMCINSKDQIGIVWTFDDKLKYFPLETLFEEKIDPQTINKEFNMENNDLYHLNLDEFESNQRYLIQIYLTKQNLGRSSGNIYINKNESEYKKLGSWSFGFRKHSDILTLEYEVTNYIKTNGIYKIKFDKDLGIAYPEIQIIRIISIPQPIKHKSGIILSPEVVIEPAIEVDSGDNNIFVWYNGIGHESDLYCLKSDYYGNIIINKSQLTSTPGKSYDPALKTDARGNIHIVWLDDLTGENAVYYMKINGNCKNIVHEKKISDNRYEANEETKEKIKNPDNNLESLIRVIKYTFLLFILILFISLILYRNKILKETKKK
jgi:hypothetical protein